VFESIRDDATSGATSLVVRASRELGEAAASLDQSDAGAFWDALVAACGELLRAGREMAPIVNLVGSVLSAAERAVLSGRQAETAALAVELECRRVWETATDRLADIGEHAGALIEPGSTVATTSDGDSVRAVVDAAARSHKSFDMIVSESRPNLEGLAMARFAGELGIAVTLVSDAALPGLASRCDLVLLGADSVSEESLVAKTGAYPLALAAREAAVPCCVVACTDKLLPAALRGDPGRPRDPEELLESAPRNVSPLNAYFEDVPLSLIRTLVTEEGACEPEDVPTMLRKRPVSPALLQLLYPAAGVGN